MVRDLHLNQPDTWSRFVTLCPQVADELAAHGVGVHFQEVDEVVVQVANCSAAHSIMEIVPGKPVACLRVIDEQTSFVLVFGVASR